MMTFELPLAPRTTLGVGGPAEAFADAHDQAEVAEALAEADQRGWPILVLGGGSNLLVADAGVRGLVLHPLMDDLKVLLEESCTHVEVGAGMAWDRFVLWSVERGLAGVECLSGIPGSVGAAPMQNVGAYGQEVSETIVRVRAWDRSLGAPLELDAAACAFGYRDSAFKGPWADRFVILSVTFALRPDGEPAARYGELAERLPPGATLFDARRAVLALRRTKAMVLDPKDPDSRSAGSFFTNPVLSQAAAQAVIERAARTRPGVSLPRWPAPGGRVKLPAAWLIEAAGVQLGDALGGAAISSRHSLAIVARPGATAADVVALAARVRRRVRDVFGVALEPEPRFVGFDRPVDELLEQDS